MSKSKKSKAVDRYVWDHNNKKEDRKYGLLKKFKVDRICVSESNIISHMFSDEVKVKLTHIEYRILEDVVDFCHRRAEVYYNSTYKELAKFDREFLSKLPQRDLPKYLRAACELGIKSLLDLTSTAIVNNVVAGEKDTRDILKMFHLKNENITLEEVEQHFEKKSWAFKRNPGERSNPISVGRGPWKYPVLPPLPEKRVDGDNKVDYVDFSKCKTFKEKKDLVVALAFTRNERLIRERHLGDNKRIYGGRGIQTPILNQKQQQMLWDDFDMWDEERFRDWLFVETFDMWDDFYMWDMNISSRRRQT